MGKRQVVRKGSGCRSFFVWILGIIMGIVLSVGGFAAVGYYAVTQDIGTLLDTAGVETDFFSEEVKQLTVLAYGQNVFSALQDLESITISELEEAIGTDSLTSLLEDNIGVDAAILGASTLSNLAETVTDNLTVSNVEENFGVAFPDIPLFEDEDFLSKPISTAFEGMMDSNLDKFITVVYDEDATDTLEVSTAFLQKLGQMSMDEVSSNMDDIIAETTLIELMEISESSPKLLQILQDCSLETQYNDDDTVAIMGIAEKLEILTLDDIVDTGESYIWEYLRSATLDDIGQKVDDMTIADVIEVNRNEYGSIIYNEDGKMTDPDGNEINAVLASMITYQYTDEYGNVLSMGLKVDDMSSELGGIIESLTIGELIEIPDDAEPILLALQDTCLEGDAINDKMKTLTISDVFEDSNSGILALVPATTLLTNISDDINEAVSTSSMYKLIELDIFTSDISSLSAAKKAVFLNSTAEDIIQDYVYILSGSLDSDDLSGATIQIGNAASADSIILNNDLLDAYGVGWGDTIYCVQNIVIEDGTVLDRVFNIVMATGSTLTFEGTASIKIGNDTTYLDSGYMYISGEYCADNSTLEYPLISIDETVGTDNSGNEISAVFIDFSLATLVSGIQ